MDQASQEQRIVRSAAIVSLGDVLSRIMGLAREAAIAAVFGAAGAASAFRAAQKVPLQLYEMLIGGMITSALVPILSAYAARDRDDELWHVASLLFTLGGVALGALVLLIELGAPLLTSALVHFDDPALQALTARLLRIVSVSVLFLGLSGLVTALCQALQRFALPALSAVAVNASLVFFTLVLGPRWGDVRVLALGWGVGAALQLLIQLPALRDMRFRPAFDLRHPALRRILGLYLPVILSLIVANLGILADQNLASRVDERAISWMSFATTLRQFPLGLVSMAVATVILPTLSSIAARERPAQIENAPSTAAFCATLANGLKLVVLLTLPAAVGLFVLARPLVAMLFQHGAFAAADTQQTALALRYYLVGLVFAAIDLPLLYAFYARHDTLRPALVGVFGVGVYLLVALSTYRSLGMVGLIVANDLQLAVHPLILLWLFRRRVGRLDGLGIGETTAKAMLATALMGGVAYVSMLWIDRVVPGSGFAASAALVGISGLAGLITYLGVCALLRVRELSLVRISIARALRRERV
jgi:putative peptidoglycan lipid II flippase